MSEPSILQDNLDELLAKLQLDDAPAGGSIVIYHKGEQIASANVGLARANTAWTPHTLSLNFSTGKGVLVTLIHILVTRKLLDYDQPIANYWPDFASMGKDRITLRQVLTHRSGLFNIQVITQSAEDILEWHRMVDKVATMTPEIPNNTQAESCYSALVSGWVLGALIEKVTQLPLNDALHKYLTEPLGITDEMYFGVPKSKVNQVAQLLKNFDKTSGIQQVDDIDVNRRVSRKRTRLGGSKPRLRRESKAVLDTYQSLPSYDCWQRLITEAQSTTKSQTTEQSTPLTTAQIVSLYLAMGQVNIRDYQHALIPSGPIEFDYAATKTLMAKIPAANGVSSSAALAKMYAMLANKGKWQGQSLISPQVFEQLSKIHVYGSDAIMATTNPSSMQWRLGYHRVFSRCQSKDILNDAFGHMGYNGSTAWADSKRQLAVSFVHNFDILMSADIRQFAINEAILSWFNKLDLN